MKIIAYNFLPFCLIALAAFLIYLNRDGWGWCIFAAVILAVVPSSKNNETDEETETEDEG